MFWFLTLCLAIGFSNADSAMEQCNVPATARINCGPSAITEAQCRAKHCCFDSNVLNVPWCFKPASVQACGL